MKHIWKSALALLLALAMTAGAFGCGSKKDADEKSTSESAASESSAEESAQPVTESDPADMDYQLTYDMRSIRFLDHVQQFSFDGGNGCIYWCHCQYTPA